MRFSRSLLSPRPGHLWLQSERLRPHSAERGLPAVPVHPQTAPRKTQRGPLPDRFKNGSGGCEPRRLRRLSRLGPVDLFRVRVRPLALQRIHRQPGGRSPLQVPEPSIRRQISRRIRSGHSDVRQYPVQPHRYLRQPAKVPDPAKSTSDFPNDVSRRTAIGRHHAAFREALLKAIKTQICPTTSPVWLPPRRRHAAPHLLIDSAGKNHLIWMSRNNPGDTISCIVLTDAAKLLTYTLPKRDFCHTQARVHRSTWWKSTCFRPRRSRWKFRARLRRTVSSRPELSAQK